MLSEEERELYEIDLEMRSSQDELTAKDSSSDHERNKNKTENPESPKTPQQALNKNEDDEVRNPTNTRPTRGLTG